MMNILADFFAVFWSIIVCFVTVVMFNKFVGSLAYC